MHKTAKLNAPGYLPTLFGPKTSRTSLLEKLLGYARLGETVCPLPRPGLTLTAKAEPTTLSESETQDQASDLAEDTQSPLVAG
jgi:hypothetical protein